MADESDALKSLLSQVETQQKPEVVSAGEIAAQQERMREAVESFKQEVLEDRAVLRRLKRFRHEGIYLKPWQWFYVILTLVAIVGVGFMMARTFSHAAQARLALQRGLGAIYAGEEAGALYYLDRAIGFNMDQSSAYLQYGGAYAELEQNDSALHYYMRAMNTARLAQEPDKAIAAGVKAARLAFDLGRRDDALKRIDTVLAIDAKQKDVLILKGRLLMAESKLDEARQCFQAAIEANPSSLTPRYYLREIALKQNRGDMAKSIEEFLMMSQLSGDEDVPTLVGYADLLVRAGRLTDAEATLVQVLSKERRPNPEIMILLGHLAIEMDEFDKAALYADSAVAIAPAYAAGHVLRGEIRYFQNDSAGALKDLQRALELAPRHPRGLYDLGCVLLYDLGLYEQARRLFLAASENGFDGPFLWYNVGACEYMLRRPEAALAAFDRMPEVFAGFPEVQWARANALLLGEETDSAVTLYERLRPKQEKNAALVNNLGVAAEVHGDSIAALKLYWDAIKLAKNPAEADSVAQRNIERLLLGRRFRDPWDAMHSEIPLRLRVVLPSKSGRKTL